jgi:hypothetical protein
MLAPLHLQRTSNLVNAETAMRAHRSTFNVVLALIAGFVLTQAICGCHSRINSYPILPGELVQSPAAGDILTWRRPNTQVEDFTLTVPTGLCALTPKGIPDPTTNTTTVTATGDEIVECKVLPQPKNVGIATYFYSIHMDTNSGTGHSPAAGKGKNKTVIIMSPTITASCKGCTVPDLDRGTVSASSIPSSNGTYSKSNLAAMSVLDQPYPISCSGGNTPIPQVTPNEIKVAQNVGYVNWAATPYGDWTVTFTGASSKIPCLNGNPLAGTACTVNPKAPAVSYPYTVTLSGCGNPGATGNAILTLQSVSSSSPPH